jgi:hypothetical protein
MFCPKEVVIDVPNTLGYSSALATESGVNSPVKKPARYGAKNGFIFPKCQLIMMRWHFIY